MIRTVTSLHEMKTLLNDQSATISELNEKNKEKMPKMKKKVVLLRLKDTLFCL